MPGGAGVERDGNRMKAPNVQNTYRDDENNMTYHVLAYRKLTRDELLFYVSQYLSQPKIRRRKTPERDKTISISTSVGAREEG